MQLLSHKKARGFTLIELMVVIAIIGILASIITVSLSSARAKGRDAKRVADIRTIQLALEEYYNDNTYYPLTLASLAPTYLPVLPSDPNISGTCSNGNESACYAYNAFDASGSNCTNTNTHPVIKYHLGASMESTNLTNTSIFNQAANWTPTSSYTLCTGGGGETGSGPFVGNSSPCGTTAVSPYSCYDETN